MKIEIAYNIDCQDWVNAEEAYDLYWRGLSKTREIFSVQMKIALPKLHVLTLIKSGVR